MLSGRTIHALDEVIVALATPAEPSERAVVRLSGGGCHLMIAGLFCPISGSPPDIHSDSWNARPISKRIWMEGVLSLPLVGSIPAAVHVWPPGRGYTRQESAEIHLVGSVPLVEILVQHLVGQGARLAQPGEFSLRAFLSGSIDLSQAEAVVALSKARGESELGLAMEQLAGGIRHPAEELRSELLDLLADLEAGLDFADEDISFVDPKQLILRLGASVARIRNLKRRMREGDTKTPLPKVALVGPPNAGKSTLFNLLTGGESRAIVSDIPGTTRDWLQGEGLLPGGRGVVWIDTAGLTDIPLSELDARGQEATRDQLRHCDLVVFCRSVVSDQLTDLPRDFPQEIPVLLIGTLADLLPPQTGLNKSATWDFAKNTFDILVSSQTGEGVQTLLSRIGDQLAADAESRIPPLGRCQTHLEQADGALVRAHRHALEDDPVELLVLEIRSALDVLGEMTGAVYTNDLLDRVFTRFCIGK